jgi:hypothetical protein
MFLLTLSYSSEGSPALAVFRSHYLYIVLSLLYLDFLTTVVLHLVVTLAFQKKILGLVLVWKSGLKKPFLSLGRSCPQQTILLSDLVGCDRPLQIVMAFWNNIIVSRGLSHPTQKV